MNLGIVATTFRLMGYQHNELELKNYGAWRPPVTQPGDLLVSAPAPVDTKY